LERACISSVLRQGHPVTLWAYEPPAGIPSGVDVADANLIVSRDRIIRHRSGSVALFTNWFRYELQRQEKGLWLDCDFYLLKPIPDDEQILTFQAPGVLNNAPLRLPPGSPLLPPLIEIFAERQVPEWLPMPARIAARWRLWRSGRAGVERMPWGSAGPHAITWLAKKHDLMRRASPPETFHPYHWTEASWIHDPRRRLDEKITPNTLGVHLWSNVINGFKDRPAPEGSFLARLQAEGAN
jgi:hypothetical protein